MIREGDRLPLALGKDVLGFKMETMAIGGAIGGLAGAYYALMQRYMSPDDAKPIETFIIWAMIVVGGRGNRLGHRARHDRRPGILYRHALSDRHLSASGGHHGGAAPGDDRPSHHAR